MRKIQIVDLDGCIADDRWRRRWIEPRLAESSNPPERFHIYHSQAWRDKAANLDALMLEAHIVILTARPALYRNETELWLKKNAIYPKFIIYRNNTDTRPSVAVKRDMVTWLLTPQMYGVKKEDIVEAIDDLDGIVEMYKTEFGLNSRVVRIGEEEHIA